MSNPHRARLRLLLGCCIGLSGPAAADVVLDGTLGPAGAVGGGLVDGAPTTYVIDESLGRRVSGNLFHSFGLLSIEAGESAAFTGVEPTAAIIARVTGGEPSLLGGRLSSMLPGADLYLLNPAGVVVGPGGSFDVPGAVHLSTADELRLADGVRFAVEAAPAAQLSSAPPAAFGFLRSAPAPVEVGAVSTALAGSLSGGRVEIGPGLLGSQGGDLGLYSTGGPSVVGLDGEGVLATPDARVELQGTRITLVAGPGGGPGSFRIRAGALVADGVLVTSRALGASDAGALDLRAGSIEVLGTSVIQSLAVGSGAGADLRLVADTLRVTEGSLIETDTLGDGAGGDVSLRAGAELVLDAASQISTRSAGAAPGGALALAGPTLRLHGGALVFTATSGSAAGGAIDVAGGVLTVGGGARLASETSGPGAGGAAHLVVDALEIDGLGGAALVQTTTSSDAVDAGRGGGIEVDARRVELTRGGQIAATTLGTGDAGDVRLHGLDTLAVAGVSDVPDEGGRLPVAAITSIAGLRAGATVTGAGGRVEIEAHEVALGSGGQILARGFGSGRAGAISLDVETLSLVGGGDGLAVIEASAEDADAGMVSIVARDALRLGAGGLIASGTSGTGDGSRVEIRTGLLEAVGRDALGNPSGVRTNSSGGRSPVVTGDGGDVYIEARDVVVSAGAEIASSTGRDTSGRAGAIDIAAANAVLLRDAARVTSETNGSGPGGAITIEAGRSIEVRGAAEISAASNDAASTATAGAVSLVAGERIELHAGAIRTRAELASGGAIRIRTRDLLQLVSSEISSRVRSGAGDGGRVDIDPRLVLMLDSRIEATAFEGDGGDVSIRADSLLRSAGSSIDASSRFGLDGQIQIDSPTSEITGEIDLLPAAFLDPFDLLRDVCTLDDAPRGSLVVDPVRDSGELP